MEQVIHLQVGMAIVTYFVGDLCAQSIGGSSWGHFDKLISVDIV